jgi:Cu/Ag efflux pump CusA
MSEQELNDHGLNFIRTQLITVSGASVPYPYGGKQGQVQVDLNPTALQSKGLSALDVVNAISLEQSIRKQILADEVESVIDHIGLPYSGINLSYSNSVPVGTSDVDELFK